MAWFATPALLFLGQAAAPAASEQKALIAAYFAADAMTEAAKPEFRAKVPKQLPIYLFSGSRDTANEKSPTLPERACAERPDALEAGDRRTHGLRTCRDQNLRSAEDRLPDGDCLAVDEPRAASGEFDVREAGEHVPELVGQA